MTIKTRRTLFLISLVLFLIASPILVEYARGLRFDFKTWQFVETGGLFFRIHYPTEISISLDDEVVKTTGSFSIFNSAFIQNLIPKNYKIKISRDGFYDWEKTLKVESELVTEAHNIVLLPKELQMTKINSNDDKVVDFYLSSDARNIALVGYDVHGQTFVRIMDLSMKTESSYIVSKNKISINLQDWQVNDGRMIFAAKDNSEFIIIDSINNQVKLLSQILPKQFTLKGVTFVVSGSQNSLFVLKENVLYTFDTGQKALKIIKKDIASLRPLNNTIYFVSQDNSSDKYTLNRANYRNSELSQQEVLGDLNFKINKSPVFDINIINSELVYVHEKSDGLLVEYSNKNGLRRVDSEISEFSLSGDQIKVLYQKKNEIWVYYRDDIKIQPFKYIGQRELIAKIPQDIISSQWYGATDNHVIYSFENSIKFVEVDERDNRNVFHVAESKSPKLIYSDTSERLYVLSDETLYDIELVP